MSKQSPDAIEKLTTIYRGYDPEHDEPANGWSGEMIRNGKMRR